MSRGKVGEMFVQQREQAVRLCGGEDIIPVELLLHEPAQLRSVRVASRAAKNQFILSNHFKFQRRARKGYAETAEEICRDHDSA